MRFFNLILAANHAQAWVPKGQQPQARSLACVVHPKFQKPAHANIAKHPRLCQPKPQAKAQTQANFSSGSSSGFHRCPRPHKASRVKAFVCHVRTGGWCDHWDAMCKAQGSSCAIGANKPEAESVQTNKRRQNARTGGPEGREEEIEYIRICISPGDLAM